MKDRIREIYKNVAQDSDELKMWREKLEKQIEIILEKERDQTNITEYETCRDRYYEIAMLAEEGGFILGFQYMLQLIIECSSKV